MSDTTFDNANPVGANRLAGPSGAAWPEKATPESRTTEEHKKSWSLARVVVLGSVVLATCAAAAVGVLWGSYRLEHTVIRNASVKGRLYKIGARIDSQIKSIEVQAGQRVTKDQILIQLVNDHIQAAARQAQAELQAALKRAEVEQLAITHDRRRLTVEVERYENVSRALTSEVKAAKSDLEKWQLERVRVVKLNALNIAPVSELDNVTTQRDSAAARVEVAQGNLAAAESNCRLSRVQVEGLKVREAGLDVLAAEVELARHRLAVCEADIAATVIRAPADGWVVEHIIEPGGSAKVGEAMLSLWLGEPWIEAWVDEKKLAQVKIGSPVDVTLTAFPGRKLRGQVESLGVLADKELQSSPVPASLHAFFSDNAMVPVRIAVADGQVRLQPGLSAIVGILNANSAESATSADSFLASSAVPANQLPTPSQNELQPNPKTIKPEIERKHNK